MCTWFRLPDGVSSRPTIGYPSGRPNSRPGGLVAHATGIDDELMERLDAHLDVMERFDAQIDGGGTSEEPVRRRNPIHPEPTALSVLSLDFRKHDRSAVLPLDRKSRPALTYSRRP